MKMSFIQLNITNLLRISAFLLVCTETFAELEENMHIDDSKFTPLEPPNSPNNVAAVPQVTYFTDILEASNAIKSIQKTLKKEKNYLADMQAHLMADTADSSPEEFRFSSLISSFIYSVFATDSTDISQPSTNGILANVTATNSSRIVKCINVGLLIQREISVEIVNSTRLGYILKPDLEDKCSISGVCTLVLFYARSCHFSTLAAPHFNVLPRIFPQIKMAALDAISEQKFNTMYGITGTPSLILFHNGYPIAKYSDSDNSLYGFTKFVIQNTDLTPKENVEISMTDFVKPVPGFGNHDYNYTLWLAWLVIIFWTIIYVRNMHFLKKFVEDIQSIWREAEEQQHEHAD